MMPAHDPSNLLESLRAQQERATALAERLRVDQARAEELIAPFAPRKKRPRPSAPMSADF